MNAEEADEEDERAPRHLVNACCDEEQANIHERCAGDVAAGGGGEEEDFPAAQRDALVFFVWLGEALVGVGVIVFGAASYRVVSAC
jgi:hypothetical protein